MKSGMRTTFRFAWFTVVAMMIALSTVYISGCTPKAKHEVLTFFFTGVPDPFAEPDEDDEVVAIKIRKKKRQGFFQEPKYFIHGPYAARECGKCHSSELPRQFQFGKANKTLRPNRYGPRLAYRPEKLCITCHEDKSDVVARSLGLSVHEPVATGMCVKCHDPHKATRQYMLMGKNTVELCSIACHDNDGFQDRGTHIASKGKDCLECHNPHVGKTEQLLRADYDEWQQFDGIN
jgi:predicted CXXCH cytochrome family protein